MIVNVGSIGGKMTLPWMTIYSASKYAVGSLTEGLRMELRRDGVNTMLVCPGLREDRFSEECARRARRPTKVHARAPRRRSAPEECALAIRRGVERDARTIVTPAAGWLLVLAIAPVPLDCGSSHGGDERNGMNLKLKRTPGIYVVGFMASGKSTVGRHLAHRLGWSFFDTDDEIEAAEKMTIAEIFTTRGEAEFRRIETEIIRQHVRLDRARPAGGAGAGRRSVRGTGQSGTARRTTASPCGWIARSKSCSGGSRQATHRPLARDPEKFAALYEARREALRPGRYPHPDRERRPRRERWQPILGHPLFK